MLLFTSARVLKVKMSLVARALRNVNINGLALKRKTTKINDIITATSR